MEGGVRDLETSGKMRQIRCNQIGFIEAQYQASSDIWRIIDMPQCDACCENLHRGISIYIPHWPTIYAINRSAEV